MTVVRRPTPGTARQLDTWLPLGAVTVLGVAAAAALAGVGSGDHWLGLAGAGLAALALIILMAGGWIDPLAALVLSLPLPALYSTTAVRLAPAAPMTALVLVAWVLAWPGRRTLLRPTRVPVMATLLLLGAFLLAGVVSPHRTDAAREIANLAVLLGLLVAAADVAARRPDRIPALVRVIAAVAAVTGALAVLETVGVLPGEYPEPSGLNRAALGFGQPNGLAMFLAISLPFVVHARRTSESPAGRWATTLALAATIGGLIGTFSRGGWLSVLAGAAVLPLAGRWRGMLRIWATALVAGIAVDLATGGALREAVLGLLEDWSVAQRAALMLAGVRMFLESPILGVGPGGFPAELDRIGALVPRLWDLKPTPHNAYIQMAAEAGLAGLAAYVAFLAALFRRAVALARSPAPPRRRSLHAALLWAVAIIIAEGMVEWPLSHGHGQLVMLVAALVCALPLDEASGGGGEPPRPAEAGP